MAFSRPLFAISVDFTNEVSSYNFRFTLVEVFFIWRCKYSNNIVPYSSPNGRAVHVLHKVSPSVCPTSHKTLDLLETSPSPTRGWWMSVVVKLESPRVLLVAARFPLDMRFKKPRQDWSGAVFPFILRHFPSSAEIRDSWIFHTTATRLLSEQTTWKYLTSFGADSKSPFRLWNQFYLYEFVQYDKCSFL